MRVITGTARGIALDAPRGDLRPTMDRVREAVFSSLGDAVPGARVLDLFAGSGSLGIEALSRGAASATFVDADREAAISIRRNLARTRLEGNIQTMDAFKFLELYAQEGGYDLIFADPPYTKPGGTRDFSGELAASSEIARALAPGGTFILEASIPPDNHPFLDLLKLKRYGKSRIAYFTAK
jgi:16S rRNA (guanine966-N2)-methyltransferase